ASRYQAVKGALQDGRQPIRPPAAFTGSIGVRYKFNSVKPMYRNGWRLIFHKFSGYRHPGQSVRAFHFFNEETPHVSPTPRSRAAAKPRRSHLCAE
ncbi:MAG: hypothetical protein O9327_11945, partial [Polaromonas sp.]|nr:hypothetical protein [Polaromonas sp.]